MITVFWRLSHYRPAAAQTKASACEALPIEEGWMTQTITVGKKSRAKAQPHDSSSAAPGSVRDQAQPDFA